MFSTLPETNYEIWVTFDLSFVNTFNSNKPKIFTSDKVLTHYYEIPSFLPTMEKKAFETIVGKGENAGHQHFLLFLQYFLSPSNKEIII